MSLLNDLCDGGATCTLLPATFLQRFNSDVGEGSEIGSGERRKERASKRRVDGRAGGQIEGQR